MKNCQKAICRIGFYCYRRIGKNKTVSDQSKTDDVFWEIQRNLLFLVTGHNTVNNEFCSAHPVSTWIFINTDFIKKNINPNRCWGKTIFHEDFNITSADQEDFCLSINQINNCCCRLLIDWILFLPTKSNFNLHYGRLFMNLPLLR